MTTEALVPPTTKSQALRSYDVADFPALTGLEEEWRFTPPKRLRGLPAPPAPAAGQPTPIEATLPDGVTLRQVAAAEAERVLVPFDRISALAYGAAPDVTLIEVAAEAVPAEAALIKVVGSGADSTSFARTAVRVGRFAQATLVLQHTGSATLADNVEVIVGDGARLLFVTIAEWDADAVQA